MPLDSPPPTPPPPASQGQAAVPVPLEEVAGNLKTVPLDHPWLEAARHVGTCMGD